MNVMNFIDVPKTILVFGTIERDITYVETCAGRLCTEPTASWTYILMYPTNASS